MVQPERGSGSDPLHAVHALQSGPDRHLCRRPARDREHASDYRGSRIRAGRQTAALNRADIALGQLPVRRKQRRLEFHRLSAQQRPCGSGIAANGSGIQQPRRLGTALKRPSSRVRERCRKTSTSPRRATTPSVSWPPTATATTAPIRSTVLIDGVNVGTITPARAVLSALRNQFLQRNRRHPHRDFRRLDFRRTRSDFFHRSACRSRPSNGNPIRIGDADSTGDEPVTVTLAVDHGTLSLNGTTG